MDSSPVLDTNTLAETCARLIRDGFSEYDARFDAVTRRARQRFERRDWTGSREDAVERIELYDRCVAETSALLESRLQADAADRGLWSAVRDRYATLIADQLDQELFKTFFNTLTRRFFRTRGVAEDIEFVALDIEPTDRITHPVARHSYAVTDDAAAMFQRVLGDYPFAAPYADAKGDAARIAAALQERLADWGEAGVLGIELLETVFYRERRAYLVGRLFGREQHAPCVIALVNEDVGLRVDAVLCTRQHVAVLFGYTHSYFHADLPTIGDAVVFLRILLPGKPLDEIYTVLGRAKQGKTERYRHFFRYLGDQEQQRLIQAEGERGMVMAVFTLPGYPLVFKLIRDKFAYPKNIAREQVREKYLLVFKHDRVGRLIDAQEYRFLRFPRSQFAPALLDELLGECRESVSLDGDDVVVHHCYVERRLRPLNLYVKEVSEAAALAAVLDYGQAIKDLARSNIFPGDLLLKNFGVTRHGRAIFYDYDELCLVSECRFRALPQPRNEEEEMHHGAWYYVAENDVFPEQFPRFLGLTPEQRAALLDVHGEIFDVAWWQALQARLRAGGYADVPPYPEHTRL
ncbi:bifunctional isocitrate dehydrogenase kinase/phosphatase [Arenimonas sp.]|uniref:bifunctional isocitrate dehydrogenase kinase/phosphatase n=1 Tax=Arenimonas sp. TaxID=1872635 RepID=UPI0039E46A44